MSTDLRLVEYGGPAAAAHAHTPHAPELRESRARIVRAGDEERRRLERDLHDGAQQRLLALGMALQLLRSHVTDRQGGVLLRETEGAAGGAGRLARARSGDPSGGAHRLGAGHRATDAPGRGTARVPTRARLSVAGTVERAAVVQRARELVDFATTATALTSWSRSSKTSADD